VNHQLEKGRYDQCHACRLPITEEDKRSEKYVPGVSCPYCHEGLTEQRRQRFHERERQIQLARQRGEQHLGGDACITSKQRKNDKQARREADRTASRRHR
jgi:UPF0176 protein